MLPGQPRLGITDDQRADAREPAVRRQQGGAAPRRMRRRGEDRVIQQVFPVPGEGRARDDDRRLRRLDPAGAGDDDRRLLCELLCRLS
jgi:hypothetical protein